MDELAPVAAPETPAVPDDNRYWASLELKYFLPEMFERVDNFYDYVRNRGFLALWRASHKAAFAGWWTGGRMNESGDNQKFTTVEANEYNNLKTHVLNMLTGQKSQPEAHAKSIDSAAQQEVVIGEALAETYADDHKLDMRRRDAAEMMLLYGEGWGAPLWDFNEGDIYAVDMGQDGKPKPLHEGKQVLASYHPLDVIRDATKGSAEGHVWQCLRRPRNKYELMAQHPKIADQIAALPSWDEQTQEGKRPKLLAPWSVTSSAKSDDVAEYLFFHEKCRAMPQGRMVCALGPELATYDDGLPYRHLPLKRASAGDVPGTIFGNTLFFDLLALQQGVNAAVSAITTRVSNFGVPTLWGPDGCKLQLTRLGEGLATLEGGTVKPEMLDFAQIPAELPNFVKMLRDFMSTYTGINSVARGQAEGGITAASALALLEARAIQFVALAQQADIEWQRDVYNQALENYQDFGDAGFIVKVTGEGNRSRAQTFTKHDISRVSSFTIQIGNALQSTTAGRMQIIEGAKALGLPLTVEQYWQVLTTGRLDPVTEAPQKEMELIRAENEQLSRGEPCAALRTDVHEAHIAEHKTVLADPEVRKDRNSPIVVATLEHIQEHEQFMMPAMTPPPEPGQPSATPPPGAGHVNSTGPMAGPPGLQPQPRVQQAQPARNPLTGAQNPHPVATA